MSDVKAYTPAQIWQPRKERGNAARAVSGNTRYYHLRPRVFWVMLVLCATAFWLLWAVTWGHELEGTSRRGGLFKLLLATLALVPIWYKLPFTIPLMAECIAGAISWLIYTHDRHPDFAISPHSVFGFQWITFRRFTWSELDRLEVRTIRRKTLTSGMKDMGFLLVFHTNRPRLYPLIGDLLGHKHQIHMTDGFSEAERQEVLELVKKYAPDLPVITTTIVVNRRF